MKDKSQDIEFKGPKERTIINDDAQITALEVVLEMEMEKIQAHIDSIAACFEMKREEKEPLQAQVHALEASLEMELEKRRLEYRSNSGGNLELKEVTPE